MIYTDLGGTGVQIPRIGQGTWTYGEQKNEAKEEVKALRYGIEHGMTLIDTAEEYANGGAERIVGEAIHDCRKEIFLTTKVSAKNCSYEGVISAAERSLERLGTTYIDLYLQHWPSQQHELEETMRAMIYLVENGMVNYIGVSNFTPELLEEAHRALGNHVIVCNQVGYHLYDRRIENNVLPFCKKQGVTLMAYSPFGYAPQFFGGQGFPEQGSADRAVLEDIGSKYGKTAYQVALNWILRHEGIVTIPKAKNIIHIESNLEALGWDLPAEDLAEIDRNFPKPLDGMPLQTY
ncbi:aldo/keto reductase [Neobacillus niacini]|uniref:aldo/keto reductase n=1 Tax=Neobacillus niacini TaxID=86668 RepID=UPI0021CB7E50|nr:aldo/keto reductase [Neobacillus niacini]MCM3766784.1 aldo/keto reductase [Neobacillus niacini]